MAGFGKAGHIYVRNYTKYVEIIQIYKRVGMLMGSKFLIKMTRPQNIVLSSYVLQPGHLYQKF